MAAFFVAGWTERIRYALEGDGVALNLTGYTIEVVAFNSSGVVALLGTAGLDTPLSGIVYFDPDPADFTVGKLKIRFKATDPTGKVAFFPNAVAPELWTISKA